MRPLQHSYSSLKMFSNCPKRYYHQRIAKDVVDLGGAASVHGDRVHKAVEDRLGPKKIPLEPELNRYEKMCQSIDAASAGCDLQMERELCITADLKPTTWLAPDVWMRSKLDLMGKKGRRGLCLDWKTGKRRPDFLQLEISAAQMFLHFEDMDIITTAFVWLRDEKMDMEVYTRDQLDDMISNVKRKAERVEEARELDVWQAKPGPLCNYCPASKICQYADSGSRRRR